MPNYVCSQNSYFFREIGRKASANEVVELPEEAYAKYQKSHPGLLRPALLNTMAEVPMVRATKPVSEESPAVPKKRGRGRAKKIS
jgi:hypothetical protein